MRDERVERKNSTYMYLHPRLISADISIDRACPYLDNCMTKKGKVELSIEARNETPTHTVGTVFLHPLTFKEKWYKKVTISRKKIYKPKQKY